MDINKILRSESVSCGRGAPMGRASFWPKDDTIDSPLYVQRIKFVDYDYDAGGAYWGGGSALYCVFDKHSTVRLYYRARDRAAAKEKAVEDLGFIPKFFR